MLSSQKKTETKISDDKSQLEVKKIVHPHNSHQISISENIFYAEASAQFFSIFCQFIRVNDNKSVESLISSYLLKPNQISEALCLAAELNFVQIIKTLIKNSSANVNHISTKGLTPLISAIKNSSLEMVKILKTNRELNPNLAEIKTEKTPLYYAVENNNDEIVQELVEIKGIDLNKQENEKKETPIFRAAKNRNTKIVKILLNKNADLYIDDINDTELLDAAREAKDDVNRLLEISMQDCLIESMQEINFISNKGGVCDGFTTAIILLALTGPSALYQHFEFLFQLKNLGVTRPRDSENKLSDVQILALQHQNLIENSESEALSEMKVSDSTKLNNQDNILFRKLSTNKIIQYRLTLAEEKKKEEAFITQINAYFNTLELIQNAKHYLNKFGFDPTLGKNDCLKILMESIKPHNLKQQVCDLTLMEFCGAYYKEELILYFRYLRNLLQEHETIKQFVILKLSSAGHVIAVLYHPSAKAWQLIDINYFPRNKKDINKFFFLNDETIAKRVALEFAPDGSQENAIFHTTVYYPGSEDKNEQQVIRKIIHMWHQSLKEMLEVTVDKVKLSTYLNGSYLYLSAFYGVLNEVKKAVAMGANVNQRSLATPLWIAAQDQYTDIVEYLLTAPTNPIIDINMGDTIIGTTPLHKAADNGNYAIAKLLLEAKNVLTPIQVNAVTTCKQTPLHFAAFEGQTKIVELLSTRDDIELDLVDENNANPIMLAAQEGYDDIVTLLLNTNKANPNKVNYFGHNSLHLSLQRKHYNIAKILIKSKKINFNLLNQNGDTPFMMALEAGEFDLAEMMTQPEYALEEINLNIINPKTGKAPLHWAVRSSNETVTQLLIESKKINLDMADNSQTTALMYAVFFNSIAQVQLLLKAGANPDLGNLEFDVSPLIMAIVNGNDEIAQLLLENGANTNLRAKIDNDSAVHVAVKRGSYQMTYSLLRYGAMPNPQCIDEEISPVEIALNKGYFDIAELLISSFAKTFFIPDNKLNTINEAKKDFNCTFFNKNIKTIALSNKDKISVAKQSTFLKISK